jgi:ATP/ADP translocase
MAATTLTERKASLRSLDPRHVPARLVAMAALFFLISCAVGVLRPVKNALALDGLGGTNFYRVYLVSALVVLFVPPWTRLVARTGWRKLVTGLALFFAANLVLFYIFFRPGSTLQGLLFYGWYDLCSAALVSQFFLATQYQVDARSAKHAYPLIIAGGSIGAAAGGAITGFFAESLGTGNLLLIAAALIAAFGLALPFAAGPGPGAERKTGRRPRERTRFDMGDLREVLTDPHVRLIAAMVLVTILVKQIVDYQFNVLTHEAFVTHDAVSAFQGKFNFATQWLPLFVLALLHPMLRRHGVGVAVLLLPISMLVANVGLALFGTLAAGVFAKATETTFRYSAERAGREILYVPVPDDLKLRARTWIDVGLEEGLGKALSAGLIFVLLLIMRPDQVAWVGIVLAFVWLLFGIEVRHQYVRTLARSIEGRFASVRGLFGSLADGTTWPIVRRALASEDPLRVAFALDLIDHSRLRDLRALTSELHALLEHPAAEIRERTLALFERFPQAVRPDAVHARLTDPSPPVREAAVRAWCAAQGNGRSIEQLLASDTAVVRTATLACIARGDMGSAAADVVRRRYRLDEWESGLADAERRVELVLAAGALSGDPAAERMVDAFLEDDDPAVATLAVAAAARLGLRRSYPKLIDALLGSQTREAARSALAAVGADAVGPLAERLLDPDADPRVRRTVPSVLARIPCEASVHALLTAVIAPETDQWLDYRTIKALSRLRAHNPDLVFDPTLVRAVMRREVDAAERYAKARAVLARAAAEGGVVALARGALADAWRERREGAFRCLGLMYPPDDIYRCYLAVTGSTASRANALEWLEQTAGHSLFRELEPILTREPGDAAPAGRPAAALTALQHDGDAWVAACTAAAAHHLGWAHTQPENAGMDLVETVFLLQRVDLLKDARGSHLALLAGIAEDVAIDRDEVIIREGEPTDALHVVTRGSVELRGMGGEITVGEGGAFGTWALIDEVPSPIEAVAIEPAHLLRIRREEFHDLVADHPELAIGLLQGLARRIRTLVA